METVCLGLKTEYLESGSGEYIFMLHGWGSKKELFSPIIEIASAEYKVIAPDFPGFGAAEEPHEAWDLNDFVNWTIEFINSFKPKSVILLGHSFGGRVIIKMAAEKELPFKISKIILAGSAGIMPARSLEYQLKVKSFKAVKKLLGFAPVKAIFPDALENYKNKKGSADYISASPVMRGCLVKVVNEDLKNDLPLVLPPTLLVWGENDDATPISDAEIMEKLMPDAGLARIKGAGHYSWLDNPYTFHAIIKSFLGID